MATVDTTRAEEAIDQLDAAIFSGDSFHSDEAIQLLEAALTRWQKELGNLRAPVITNTLADWHRA